MLSPDIEMVDLDGDHWGNWLELLWPPGLDRSFGYALVFTDGDALVRVVRDGQVVAPGDVTWTDRSARGLSAVRKQLSVGALINLDGDALPRLFGDFESHLSMDDDYVGQWLEIWSAVKRAAVRGDVRMDPPLLELIPAPSADALQKTFDLMIPDEAALIAYVFDDEARALHTSLIASKDAGDIAFVTTHLGIEDEARAAYLARDWRKRYPRVLEVIGDRFDRPCIGVFAERGAVQRILAGPPDQLTRELAERNVIIDPAPVWLRALLGGAAVAATATRGAAALSRFIPKSARRMAQGVARQAQDRMKEAGVDPWAALGFNPIEIWLDVRRFLLPQRR